MKKKIAIVGAISIFVALLSASLYFGNIRRNEKKVQLEIEKTNKEKQAQEQDLRKRCELVGWYCYGNNIGSTLNAEGKADYDLILKTQEICNEGTKACLQVFGLEERK